ncbi:hypothetical protein CEXT_609151 [Caerostris extrusa]|uniref:Uncharacterized protein n=1 Tax=Caerostris extrusa TaxID=172846 RepID=A0AAV4PCN7_CAEEX|nr:hypothetical protein CEXT_609151 [Caerostris extrusa]
MMKINEQYLSAAFSSFTDFLRIFGEDEFVCELCKDTDSPKSNCPGDLLTRRKLTSKTPTRKRKVAKQKAKGGGRKKEEKKYRLFILAVRLTDDIEESGPQPSMSCPCLARCVVVSNEPIRSDLWTDPRSLTVKSKTIYFQAYG